MSLLKIPQTRVIKKLGLSTVVAWDLSNCVSVEESAGDLDLSARKVLPTHIKITSAGTVTLPDARLHQGRAITVKAVGVAISVTDGLQVTPVSIDGSVDSATEIVYSDGSAWVAF